MKAALYESFRAPLSVVDVTDPAPADDGVVVEVEATGVCMSDWHGWMGHDRDIRVPHVPGHEFAGVVAAVGSDVSRYAVGDRVTAPFVCACGCCEQCSSGNQQICDNQTQPGFTHWGSYAEYVALRHADLNLVRLPEAVDFRTAASLGCRFATAFRAVVDQGEVSSEQWVAVHGCGGVGLSAVMIAAALGARVAAVDVDPAALRIAAEVGAELSINGAEVNDVATALRDSTGGGVHCSIDAFGSRAITAQSLRSLRKRGRHVQVGLMVGEDRSSPIPMDMVIANELTLCGSHGMQAHRYDAMMEMIVRGRLDPGALVQRTVTLGQAARELGNETPRTRAGVTVIDRFGDADA